MSEDAAGARPDGADEEKWPIGFMLTIALAGLYLAWRLVQGIVVLVDWLL